eukprot:GHUV01006065.1.p1 GENE.GHUV01006065.1~~GHUV01006065.1.p1  ORF type:complete len:240 (+),score=79.69 GHUV01006065.1:122-841(+)
MAVSDRPDVDDDHDSEGEGLSEEQYEWLQQQLAHIGNLHIETAGTDGEEEWVDPSGGILVNIFAACEEGIIEQLTVNLAELKDTEQSIDTPGPDGDTALHLACLYGHLPCVELLLREGANADVVNSEDGTTAVHDAAAGGYLDIIQLLFSKTSPSSVSLQDADGDTALHNAARGGHLDVVQYLLQQGADPTVKNSSGKTPAAESDDREVIRALVTAAAGLVQQAQQQAAGYAADTQQAS